MSSHDAGSMAPSIAATAGGGMVTIEVGLDARKYQVHKALLIHHSEYFRNALRGDWKEASEGVVPLVDIEPFIFSIFVDWLYTGKLPESDNSWLGETGIQYYADDACEKIDTKLSMTLLKAYIFGDRFIAPLFRAAVMVELPGCIRDMVDIDHISSFVLFAQHAHANLHPDSIVLQCLIDTVCRCWSYTTEKPGVARLALQQLPPAMLCRTIEVFSDMRVAKEEAAKTKESREVTLAALLAKKEPCFRQKMQKVTVAANMKLRPRCYKEHLTDDEKTTCSLHRKHMVYDKDADFGFFK